MQHMTCQTTSPAHHFVNPCGSSWSASTSGSMVSGLSHTTPSVDHQGYENPASKQVNKSYDMMHRCRINHMIIKEGKDNLH